MTYMYRDDSENTESAGFDRLLDELESGDCMVVERFSGAAKNTRGFLTLMDQLEQKGVRFRSLEEDFDTGTEQGRYALSILQKAAQLDGDYRREKQRDGIHQAKEDGKYKGRKPIEVDEDTFNAILEQWRNGEITARQAMNALNLKPNTFYRRVKERMSESGSGEAIWDAAKQLGKDIVDGAQQTAEKLAQEYDVENLSRQLGKNISAAGMVLGRHVENLSKDFQEAVEKFEQNKANTPEPPEQEEPQDPEWV